MASTHSPDPNHLAAGAGTAQSQSNQPRQIADPVGGGWDNLAETAVAGTPGSWGPAGYVAPATVEECSGVVASPATAWTAPTHVVLRDGNTHVHWDGNAWVEGNATGLADEPQQETRKTRREQAETEQGERER